MKSIAINKSNKMTLCCNLLWGGAYDGVEDFLSDVQQVLLVFIYVFPGLQSEEKQGFVCSLVRFNGTVNTVNEGHYWCQGCVQTDVLSGNHKAKSVVLYRLLTQHIEAHKNPRKEIELS